MPGTASEAAYDGWQALGLMMEGCVQSGKWDVLHALVQLSQGQLAEGAYPLVAGVRQGAEEQEPFHGASDSCVGTSWLVKGLVSAADHHLKAFTQGADGQRPRCWPVVQRIRLDLPGPDGFEF
jgi:hypothetical protein